MSGDEKRFADLESRVTTAEENLIRMATARADAGLNFVQKYAGVLILCAGMLGLAVGHAIPH